TLTSSYQLHAFFIYATVTSVFFTLSLHDALPILIILVVFLPNSPRWLAEKGRHIEAEEVLRMLRDTSEKAREELNEIRESLKLRSEEHTSELQSRFDLVCRLLLEKKNKIRNHITA